MARPFLVLSALALLAACEPDTPKQEDQPEPAPEAEAPEPGLRLIAAGYPDLPGWAEDDLDGALQALSRSCARLMRLDPAADVGTPALPSAAGDWQPGCTALSNLGPDPAPADLRAVLERHYRPYLVTDIADGETPEAAEGLFTGYFEAELTGARTPDETYRTPLFARPDDLITVDLGRFDPALQGKGLVGTVRDGRLVPYPTREEIEAGALAERDLELLWIDDPVDAFLLQVQGSGRVILPDGEVVRVGFAAHNGHDYRSIGRRLIDLGELEAHAASWDGIRGWIEANPERAAELFAYNPRFIFFRLLDGPGPIGAEGVALTPLRSLAVDDRYIPLGAPLWLDTTEPGTEGGPLRRLMVAQDKGGAIKGVVRGDFFWGYGDEALAEAGRMKSRGRYYLLLPTPLADRLDATS
jgi:membrane-bound lytic murein transglycosylase A